MPTKTNGCHFLKISLLCPGPVNTNFNNVANVKFKAKGMSSEYVAKYTVKRLLKCKFVIVPGIHIKLLRFFAKITPNNIMTKLVYSSQERKR